MEQPDPSFMRSVEELKSVWVKPTSVVSSIFTINKNSHLPVDSMLDQPGMVLDQLIHPFVGPSTVQRFRTARRSSVWPSSSGTRPRAPCTHLGDEWATCPAGVPESRLTS